MVGAHSLMQPYTVDIHGFDEDLPSASAAKMEPFNALI